MAKRVTVSIPDMLHEQMEKWRESFNLSKMFQDAVTEAIQKKEDFNKRIKQDLEMGEIIERLRREKAHSERNYFDKGREDGFVWARSACYEDLIYALNWRDDEHFLKDPVLGPYFSEQTARNKLLDEAGAATSGYVGIYINGWRKGLGEFWDAVKDKLQ